MIRTTSLLVIIRKPTREWIYVGKIGMLSNNSFCNFRWAVGLGQFGSFAHQLPYF